MARRKELRIEDESFAVFAECNDLTFRQCRAIVAFANAQVEGAPSASFGSELDELCARYHVTQVEWMLNRGIKVTKKVDCT